MMTERKSVYMDYNATTPCLRESLELYVQNESALYGNPSSLHAVGRKSLALLDDSRERLASLIHADSSEVFFTSGGTESNNLAIWSAIAHGKKNGRDRILMSSIEHHSVLDAVHSMARSHQMAVTTIDVNSDGCLNLKDLKRNLDPSVALLCIMHSNNETGVLQPVREALELAAEFGVVTLVDAIQTFGKYPLDVRSLPCDFLTLSSHKIYGPKGVGAIYASKRTKVESMFKGGSQEKNVRPGTEPTSLIASFVHSAQTICNNMSAESDRQKKLIQQLKCEITEGCDGSVQFNTSEFSIPNTLSITYSTVSSASLLMALDMDGIYVSAGSACTAGSSTPSHVIQAITGSAEKASSSIRYSIGIFTTEEDIHYAAIKSCEHVNRIRFGKA